MIGEIRGETSGPELTYREGYNNYSELEEATYSDDPVGDLISKYRKKWPDTSKVTRDVAMSLRSLRSNLFPKWMSEDFANAYTKEASSFSCAQPEYEPLEVLYKQKLANADEIAASKEKRQEDKLISDQRLRDDPKNVKKIDYIINPSDHSLLLTRAVIEEKTSVISDLQTTLSESLNKCYTDISHIGDSYLKEKDTSPQVIPPGLLDGNSKL